ncbi:gamma-aminobutyraldehyde dehydrogenase [Sinomonas terrae]|uniref:Gamma-aminobutyraldehyde dehydrogenase n=1 Tax=Sinomonas terrae TaxID=2908838 RepID=A0ABS9U6W5_9MICC|nr:gamma-aminobutyraldehyde dehydrogenase [Sinomonas terrae]MCH6472443.1 gamma-aminobutyraldehyde dehydrogenase [Sinomonas terrae]
MSEGTINGLQFIGGKRRRGSSQDPLTVIDPSNGRVLAEDDNASPAEVDEAVDSAKAAFTGWSRATPAERSAALWALAGELETISDELIATESAEAGKPVRLATEFDIPGSIDNVKYYAGLARNLEGKAAGNYSGEHISSIRREPLGVIGSIAPWNYPLQVAMWKVLPAIAAGNTIVLKPSELTPGTTLMLAEAAQRAGIPDGVINVVTGTGEHVGDALVGHKDVAMVSFTGSTAVGRRVAARAASDVKRVHLELGGKAPFVVFDDADLAAAARGAMAASLVNTGQDCTAATRAYVQRPLYDAFVEAVAEHMREAKLGPTSDPATDLGPLISMRHRERVQGFVERARRDGAKIVVGGAIGDGELSAGSYYQPTLITNADQKSEIVQSEVFGPVLTVLPFDDDEEGLELANDTPYGLSASAWTSDIHRAQTAADLIQAGCVWINDHVSIISEMPHGGYKLSGFGKDMSTYSFEEYTQIKHVMSSTVRGSHRAWNDVIVAPKGRQ